MLRARGLVNGACRLSAEGQQPVANTSMLQRAACTSWSTVSSARRCMSKPNTKITSCMVDSLASTPANVNTSIDSRTRPFLQATSSPCVRKGTALAGHAITLV